MCHLSFTVHPDLMRRVFSSGGNWLWRVNNSCEMTHRSCVGRRAVGIRDSNPRSSLLSPPLGPSMVATGWETEVEPELPRTATLCQPFLDRCRGVGLSLNVPPELWLMYRIHRFLSHGVLPSWRVCLLINPHGQAFQFPFHSWRYYLVHFFDGWRCTNRF